MSPNRLAKETSPYLQQHANNPVDWYPWGEEAFAKAKKEGKPLLLSIGYSSCHWCHVMEKESFEDEETARLMNQNFVNVKVDREERPDLDSIYMEAVQAMTGQGGWPMTVFLTPDGKPFHAGTYFPPVERGGIPSFGRVLKEVARFFREKRREVEGNAQAIQRSLSVRALPRANEELDPAILENAFLQLTYSYDKINGGFGRAPKFPQPSALELLLRLSKEKDMAYGLRMVANTLTKMAKGGVYDHLGGGFHRYAVDSRWLIPHFEKMLYDNAQLSLIYLHTYQISRNQLYRRIVEETLDYIVRVMRHPLGGFYSTQDADTEGEEGRFYIWARNEVEEALGKPDSEVFCRFFGISETGNFEGKNILSIPSEPQEVAASLRIPVKELERIVKRGKKKLFEVREMRIKPSRDEKVLASWNGLMTKGFAEAARVLGRDDYRIVAEDNARFMQESMFVGGELMHSWKDGKAKVGGFLEDYAFIADAFLSLYLTNFNPGMFEIAHSLAETILERFQDRKDGGFYDTAEGDTSLFVRPKTIFDYSTPSGGSVAARVLQTMGNYTGDNRFRDAAKKAIKSAAILLEQQPMALCGWLEALDSYLSTPIEVALVGEPESPDLKKMLSVIFEPYRPDLIVALQPAGSDYSDKIPLLLDRTALRGQSTAYVCRERVCLEPLTDPTALANILDRERKTKKTEEAR